MPSNESGNISFLEFLSEIRLPDWCDCIPLVREYQGIEGRQFRFDFAWPSLKLAVDIEGGFYRKGKFGGHNSIPGIERDMEKSNLAQGQGWIVLRFSTAKLKTIKHRDALAMMLFVAFGTQWERYGTDDFVWSEPFGLIGSARRPAIRR